MDGCAGEECSGPSLSLSTSSSPRILPPVLQPKRAQACTERSQAGLAKRSRVTEPLSNPRYKPCEEEPTHIRACAHAREATDIAVIARILSTEHRTESGEWGALLHFDRHKQSQNTVDSATDISHQLVIMPDTNTGGIMCFAGQAGGSRAQKACLAPGRARFRAISHGILHTPAW